MSKYAAYPYYQELGELVAICDLDADASDIINRACQDGGYITVEDKARLFERRVQFDAIQFADELTEWQQQLRAQFETDYVMAAGFVLAVLSAPPDKRQDILVGLRPKLSWLLEHFRTNYQTYNEQRRGYQAYLEAEHGE